MALVHGIPGFAGEVFTPDSEGYQEMHVQSPGLNSEWQLRLGMSLALT